MNARLCDNCLRPATLYHISARFKRAELSADVCEKCGWNIMLDVLPTFSLYGAHQKAPSPRAEESRRGLGKGS